MFPHRLCLLVKAHGLRHMLFQIANPGCIGRVCRQKFDGLLTLRGLAHILPQIYALARIEAGFRHQINTNNIGFALLRPAIGHQDTVLCTQAEHTESHLAHLRLRICHRLNH